MSMFSNAHNFQISGGEFQIVQHIHAGQTGAYPLDEYNSFDVSWFVGIDALREVSIADAAVDAESRRYAPTCCPGTRDQLIIDITDWAAGINNNQTQRLLWMWGPAGVGKSALAQTCAEKVKDRGFLGAAYFFSINGRTNHQHFFITLAYQLSTVLSEYRQTLDSVIYNDKALFTKNMKSQFSALIVQPLEELERQGRRVGQKAIFIDGLDECANTDAQVEIIEVIASSVRAQSTPFRWAIFSRAESHIRSTFEDNHTFPLVRIVELPIRSPDDDPDIELYIRTEFKNILRRRNLSLSWPSDKVITSLVKAAGGLFAYAATVLRFIDLSTTFQLEDLLRDVLTSTLKGGSGLFAGLDALYMLIMQRIPKDILPTAQILFAHLGETDVCSDSLSFICNYAGISQSEFLSVYHHLHAVLKYTKPQAPSVSSNDIDFTQPYFGQNQSLIYSISRVHGHIDFHHKSFLDFLVDPARSSAFCLTTHAMTKKMFNHHIQRHHHFARNYAIQGTKLVLAPGVPSSFASLSWPHGSEFVDSYLQFRAFCYLSRWLSHNSSMMFRILENVPSNSLKTLGDIDYRKYLIAEIMFRGNQLFKFAFVLGSPGWRRVVGTVQFQSIHSDDFTTFDPERFLLIVKKFEDLGIIKPHHPRLPSPLASVSHAFSRRKPYGKCSGLYRMGHGEKSVIWYWEFDMKTRYFHQFRTVDLAEAMKIYKKSKFAMWEDSWIPSS